MKLTRTRILFFTLILALLLSVPAVINAQDLPHTFLGKAYVDNSFASEGTIVAAFIDGRTVAQSDVREAGTYFLLIPPEIDGLSSTGKTITFRIRGLRASETAEWTNAGNTKSFNLTASTTTPTNTPRPTPAPRATAVPTTAPTVALRLIPGPTGLPGAPGATGVPGAMGVRGATGVAGAMGVAGATGVPGATSVPGVRGDSGSEGPRGNQGPQGYIGQTGVQGPPGAVGSTGVQGPAGPPGSQGNFMIAIIALLVALMALLVAIGRWVWELQTG